MDTIKRGDRVAIVELARDAVYVDGEWHDLPGWVIDNRAEQRVLAVGMAVGHHSGAVMVEVNKMLFPASMVKKMCTTCEGLGGWEYVFWGWDGPDQHWIVCSWCEGSRYEPTQAAPVCIFEANP